MVLRNEGYYAQEDEAVREIIAAILALVALKLLVLRAAREPQRLME